MDSNKNNNTEMQRSFFESIRNGNEGEIRKQVAADSTLLLAYDEKAFGATPLTLAVQRNDLPMTDLLLELGADIDRASNWWAGPWSPLHCALYNADDQLANYLLDRGATLDVHAAAGLNRITELRNLLSNSPAEATKPGGDGCQPLHFAGSIESASILLDHGADIDARCIDHFSTPAQYLAIGRPEVARFLFAKGAQPDIFSAVLAGDSSLVESILKENPGAIHFRINEETFPPGPEHDVHNIMTFTVGTNSTPLQAAAKSDQIAMMDVLVGNGADANGTGGYDDATALHIAAWENNVDAADKLLDLGANINARSGNIHNNTPAGWAIVAGSDRVFARLMDRGATKMDWFERDVQAAEAGEFVKYKVVASDNYARIRQRLDRG